MKINNLDKFIEIAKEKGKKTVVIAAAEDDHVLSAVRDAIGYELIEPIFVGKTEEILKISNSIGLDISKYQIIEADNPKESAHIAAKLVHDDSAQVLMKGLISTSDFLRAVLNKDYGLRTGELLSHIGIFETAFYHKLIGLTDAAQNIAPDLNTKVGIINNAVDLFHRLGVPNPKVAMISAIEKVNPKMPSTVDAAIIKVMNERNQITGCLIDGPFALDNAISKEAAEHKGIASDVSGDCDLLVAPNIEVANSLYKSLTYFAGATVAAILLGAKAPIVLTSRADTERNKLMSLALACSY